MDAELYSESIQYEKITQSVYQAILQKEGIDNIEVQHNVSLKGRSGVAHQIDVLWIYKQAGIEQKVLIECKNFGTSLTLEKVRNFFAVLHDIGNSSGVMVTKSGYQSGAKSFAEHYGIGLKLLRKPNEDDWEGRIKDIHVSIKAKTVLNSEDNPLVAQLDIEPTSSEQKERLLDLQERGLLLVPSGADLRFLDSEGNISTDEMRWFLPRELVTIDKDDGGPYTQNIELEDKYLLVNKDTADQELIKVSRIVVTYYVESFDHETIRYGEDIVNMILKDYSSNELEHVHRN
ncbi:restriction endonuclease [Plesiomonas shigelloides]|uniref:restriction endonuclease n=1 Tax=Plesiomonas shigelloides TaxID=703 RepID=UPI00068E3113|nr:restriction endonuclease [Plesiomonas shigelloides]